MLCCAALQCLVHPRALSTNDTARMLRGAAFLYTTFAQTLRELLGVTWMTAWLTITKQSRLNANLLKNRARCGSQEAVFVLSTLTPQLRAIFGTRNARGPEVVARPLFNLSAVDPLRISLSPQHHSRFTRFVHFSWKGSALCLRAPPLAYHLVTSATPPRLCLTPKP